MAVLLRSGRKLDEKRIEKDTKEEKYADFGEEFKQHSSETTEEEKTTRMQLEQQVKKGNPGKRKRLRIMNLKFHSLKGCRRQGLKSNSLDS